MLTINANIRPYAATVPRSRPLLRVQRDVAMHTYQLLVLFLLVATPLAVALI